MQRDSRLDFFRGWVLITIFISHIPNTVFTELTHGNFGFTDSADAFVFMAGISAAFAYGKHFVAGSRAMTCLKALHRALVLYCVHITITVMAIALVGGFSLGFSDTSLLERFNIAPLLKEPVAGFVGMAVLSHQLGYFNILPLYSVLLCFLPLMLWMANKHHYLLLAASLILWMSAMLFWLNLPTFPNEGGWTFNPFSWQLYFVFGLLIGLRRLKGVELMRSRLVFCLASMYLLMALLCIIFELWGWPGKTGLPWFIIGFDKTYITPIRLFHFLALAYVLTYLSWVMRWSSVKASNPVALLGKHALPVFAIGSLLSLLGQLIKFQVVSSFWLDSAIIFTGIALQIALAKGLEWRQKNLKEFTFRHRV